MRSSPSFRLALVVLLFLATTGCLFRSRKVERRITTAPLQEATKAELVARINADAARIQTLNATVDIAPSVGGTRKGKVTEYKDMRGYVLVRKPDSLRMIGLLPIVRNRAFDMVSEGETFRLWIPPRNRFIVGSNDVVTPSKQPLENLRPQQIFDAFLLREIGPQEIAVLEAGLDIAVDPKTDKEVEQPNYILNVIRPADKGGWLLSRKIVFDRVTLEPQRQIVYDETGNIATDTRYGEFQEYGAARFPSIIEIWRPQEEYRIVLSIVRLRLNEPLRDDQFELQQPAGAEVVRLNGASEKQTRAGNGSNSR